MTSRGRSNRELNVGTALYSDYWILPETTLGRLAQWGASRPVKSQPNDEVRRLALGAVTALAESIHRIETQSAAPWARELPLDTGELSSLMGVTAQKAATALMWLERTRLVMQSGRGRWQVAEEEWGRASLVSAIAWDTVRAQLRENRTPLAPALALLRTLALRIPLGVDPRVVSDRGAKQSASETWCTLSSTDFIEATLFQRSAVLHGLAALVATGFVEQEARPGQRGRWRLTPLAFGERRTAKPSLPQQGSEPIADIKESLGISSNHDLISPTGQAIQVQIAGIHLSIPPGATIRMTVDEMGRRTYHVGTDDMIIGPVE